MKLKEHVTMPGLAVLLNVSVVQAQDDTSLKAFDAIHSCLLKNTSERSFPSKTRRMLEDNAIINIDRYDFEEKERLKQEFLGKIITIALDEYFCKTGLDIQDDSPKIIELKQEVIDFLEKLNNIGIFGHTQIIELENIERKIRDNLKTLQNK